MRIIHTSDFKNNTILADRGIKCVIHGYAFVKDTKKWLYKKAIAEETAYNNDLNDITIEELYKNCQLITDEDKNDDDILNNLFDVTYEPCLELTVPEVDVIDSSAAQYGTVFGGEKFATYKIRVNSALNNKTNDGIKGTYRAIVLIGEKYTENDEYVWTKNKSYIATILMFGLDEPCNDAENADGLHIEENTAFTINLQFTLSQVSPDIISALSETSDTPSYKMHNPASSFSIQMDPEYGQIMEKTRQKDQTTVKLAAPSVFLVPSGKEYQARVELEAGVKRENEGIMYMDKTLDLIPNTSKNNNIFNVTPRVNIFDEHNDKFVKPQMLLSYGGVVNDAFEAQSVGFEYDPSYFALNEKAPTGETRFDVFGGATKSENNAYYDDNFTATDGYLRLLCDRGLHFTGKNDLFIRANSNSAGMTNGSLIMSDKNYVDNATDFHSVNSNQLSAEYVSGGFVIGGESCLFEKQSGIAAIDARHASATNDITLTDNGDVTAQNISPISMTMLGMNVSSFDYNGYNNIYIGHKGLLSNTGHDTIVFGNHNACGGNKEYDICPECEGTGENNGAVCIKCNGHGFIESYNHYRFSACPECSGLAGKETCDVCNGIGKVKYQTDVGYEDGAVIKVGDGYFYKHLMKNPKDFDIYNDYVNIRQEDSCDTDIGLYLKRMNLFSVESRSLLTVHNNNYDDVPDSDVTHNIASNFFAIRGWAQYDTLQERFANLQNGCYAPDAIYFTKRTAHNEEWKLRIRELDYLIHDSYIKTNTNILKTDALNQAISEFYDNNTSFTLRLNPIITYRWDSVTPGRKGFKGVTNGAISINALKGLKGTVNYKGMSLSILNMRYKYYIEDILAYVHDEFGKVITNNGNIGKNDETYTFYCVNCDQQENIYVKGTRLRKMNNGNYQTLNATKGVRPTEVQRVIYKDNGYNGEYGVMNFDYYYKKFLI